MHPLSLFLSLSLSEENSVPGKAVGVLSAEEVIYTS